MTDLHSRLVEAITARLALAEAALAERESDWWWGPDAESAAERHIAANRPEFVIEACRADLELLEQHRPDENDDCRVCCAEADMVVEWDDEADEESVEWVRRPSRSPCGSVRNRAGVYGVNLDEQEG